MARSRYWHALIRSELCVVAMLLALVGCSSLSGRKFDMVLSNDKIDGVPFTINKPRFTVIRTPGTQGAPDAYVIKADYVPDPNGHYILQIHPSTLSTVEFTMKYDDNGSLTDTTVKTTDQTATVLAAVGKLAASAIALADVAETDREGDAAVNGIRQVINKDISTGSPGILDPGSESFRSITADDRAVWLNMENRLKKLYNAANVREKFFYHDKLERAWLATALAIKRLGFAPSVLFEVAIQDAHAVQKNAVQLVATQIDTAYRSLDLKPLRAIRDQLRRERINLRKLDEQLSTEDTKSDIENNWKLWKAVRVALKQFPPDASLLIDLVEMDPSVWQHRRIMALNQEIATRQQLLRTPDRAFLATTVVPVIDREGVDPVLQSLRRQKAAALGLLPEYDRGVLLRGLVTKAIDVGSYRRLADEIAFIDKRLLDAETALKPATSPDAKADEAMPAELLLAEPSQPVTPAWVLSKLEGKRPNYVIVLAPPQLVK